MSDVLEKKLPLKIENKEQDSSELTSASWMKDMEAHEEQATDQILEHLIQSGSRPHVQVTGDIVDVVTAIVTTLQQHVPSHLSQPLKIMTDYIARWLCDYMKNTNTIRLHIAFGFDAQLSKEEIA